MRKFKLISLFLSCKIYWVTRENQSRPVTVVFSRGKLIKIFFPTDFHVVL